MKEDHVNLGCIEGREKQKCTIIHIVWSWPIYVTINVSPSLALYEYCVLHSALRYAHEPFEQ